MRPCPAAASGWHVFRPKKRKEAVCKLCGMTKGG